MRGLTVVGDRRGNAEQSPEPQPGPLPGAGAAIADDPSTRLFHGGVPGLQVGDRLVSPGVTHVPSCADHELLAAVWPSRHDRVYATPALEVARVYAALRSGCAGDVYEVELDEPVEEDVAGESVCAPAATVVAVVERGVRLDVAKRAMLAMAVGLEGEA